MIIANGGSSAADHGAATMPPLTGREDHPFFIVGCGRSGTTLLRLMLNQHSAFAIPLESLFIADYLRLGSAVPAEVLRHCMIREYELREWNLDLTAGDLANCPTAAAMIEQLHVEYARSKNRRRWGQKTPRLIRHWRALRDAFPHARFIHLVRDPRAVVRSLMFSPIHRNTCRTATQRWIRDVSYGRRLTEELQDGSLEIGFAGLIEDPEATLRTVCGFLNEPFEHACLSYASTGTAEYSHYYESVHAKLNEQPDPSRIAAWQEDLDVASIAFIEDECRVLMAHYGFKPTLPPGASSPQSQGLPEAFDRGSGFIGRLAYYLRHRPGYIAWVAIRKLLLHSLLLLCRLNAQYRRLSGLVLGILAFVAVVGFAGAQFNEVLERTLAVASPSAGLGTLASLVLVSVGFLCLGSAWFLLVRAPAATSVGLSAALRIWTVTQMAKYLPGSVWHYVARAEMLARVGVGRTVSVWSIGMEAIINASTALLTTSVLFIAVDGSSIVPALSGVGWLWLPGVVLLGASIGAGHRLIPNRRSDLDHVFALNAMTASLVALGRWILVAVGFYVLSRAYGGESGGTPLALAVFPLAWVAGYIAIFAPGGIGVREAVIVFSLSDPLGAPSAAALALVARLWWMLGELLSLCLAWLADALVVGLREQRR